MKFNFNKDNYIFTIDEISQIASTVIDEKMNKFKAFLIKEANFIKEICSLEKELDYKYFTKSFEELLEDNNRLYDEVKGEGYKTSYCNPTYAVEVLGKELGQIATVLASSYRGYIEYAFSHNLKMMHFYNEYFLSIYNYVSDMREINALKIKELLKDLALNSSELLEEENLNRCLIKTDNYKKDIIENSDLEDIRYLFKYGSYISENEIKTAQFLNKYKDIDLIATTVVNAYIQGFKRDNKDYTKKSTARVIANVGQEQILRALIRKLKESSIEAIFSYMETTSPNKQFDYDHKFDMALSYDEEISNEKMKSTLKAFENNKDGLNKYGGVLVFEKFGDIPFAPESKKEALKLNEKQSKILQSYRSKIMVEEDKYIPESETSFTIIAFPVPEIGENFEEIFEDILKINLLDSNKYSKIQQSIIDALDKADYVHVKGFGNNKTDIKVKMNEIVNPEKETNFENCVADVNIPVGEVFTSPTLKCTNGILHVDEVYLGDLKYKNLELKFKDGYVEEYTCTNFAKEEENKNYIKENLLFPHSTLPIGEFAIGTNTLAYVIAKKHDIVNLLPILIVEKMGPHFAIGDTCYSYVEDISVYNPDGKEIIARDNEKSILRKTDIENAYTGCHTDITIPYDDIEFITCVSKDGEKIDIIRDGRFVLEGAKELNKAFI